MQVCAWMINMENEVRPGSNERDMLNTRSALLVQGLLLAYNLRHLATTFISLHLELGVAMTRAHVASVFRLVEMMKVSGLQDQLSLERAGPPLF